MGGKHGVSDDNLCQETRSLPVVSFSKRGKEAWRFEENQESIDYPGLTADTTNQSRWWFTRVRVIFQLLAL